MLDFSAVLADIEPQVGVNAHVLVGNPDQRETADQVAAPVIEKELVMGDEEEEDRYVMAEAEFAGKEKIKFTAKCFRIAFTLADAVFARLAEDFFMGDRPGNAGNRDSQREQPHNLQREGHI